MHVLPNASRPAGVRRGVLHRPSACSGDANREGAARVGPVRLKRSELPNGIVDLVVAVVFVAVEE